VAILAAPDQRCTRARITGVVRGGDAARLDLQWAYAEIPFAAASGKANEINGRIWPSYLCEKQVVSA
jgi:hypothetical protein